MPVNPEKLTPEMREIIDTLSTLTHVSADRICTFAVIVTDHDDNHIPVTLTSMGDRNEISSYLIAVGMLVASGERENL